MSTPEGGDAATARSAGAGAAAKGGKPAGPSLLPNLFRTTAFRLLLVYLSVFAISVFLILGYVAWNTTSIFNEQFADTIEAEIGGLAEQYRLAGIRRLVAIVDRRSRQPGASLYLVTTFQGERIAGNVGSLTPGTLDNEGQREADYARTDEDLREHRAIVRVFLLPGGFRLLVGRDIEDRVRLRQIMGRALGVSLLLVVVLGCLGGWFVTRRVLGRIDGMAGTAQTIMAGDLAGRLAVAGTGDELDRLALNLNAMLDRIGELMTGIAEVSNNIAHDLKTPLTRLRNRAEEALRSEEPDVLREALEKVIEESDNLIRIFNALLMIARLEAGHASAAMADFDAAEVTEGLVELYGPLAEEAGTEIELKVAPDLPVHGSRELVGQAVANLIDNAIKYGGSDEGVSGGPVVVTADRDDATVHIRVADRGPGIPAEDRERVLGRFVRLEPARSRPGFGLGLSLAAAVARLHGGALTLRDHGPGLEAVLTLPARPRGMAPA